MSILDWIYPKRCVGCGRSGRYICRACAREAGAGEQALRYEGVVRGVIKEIKYRGSFDMVEELVDLWQARCNTKMEQSIEMVTSVPMWRNKQQKRGFNQAELLAREMARRWQIPYHELLTRTRATRPMYGLTKLERLANVRGVFMIRRGQAVPKRVILVDDVWTTGATMRECAKILKLAGVREVSFVTIAR